MFCALYTSSAFLRNFIAGSLYKEKCKKLSKRISKYKEIIPFTEEIAAFGIGINELLALEIGIKEAAKYSNLPFVGATMRLIDDIKGLNKINGLN